MKFTNLIAALLSLIAILAAYLVADRVFERMPHIEDEMAYVWQAQALNEGKLMLPSPPDPKSIMIPFVVDYHGQRFGKYPPGWPLVLDFGLLLHIREWVNPLLAGASVWLTYRLAKKLFDQRVALVAALLTLTSPFFLLNSGSLLSHSWSLFLSLAFVLAWLDAVAHHNDTENTKNRRGVHAFVARKPPAWLTVWVAGLSLGVLALTRPLTAAAVGLPFLIHGVILLLRGDRSICLRVLTIGLLAALVSTLVPLWQFAVTGDPLLNPYTLWWKYDKIGFGSGIGRQPGGHSLYWAWVNLKFSFGAGWGDFFGWGHVSWLFLPFGIVALGRAARRWLVACVFPSIVLLYVAYWVGSDLYGPRYYFEGFCSLTLVSAAGIFWLAERAMKEGQAYKWMKIAVSSFVVFLIGYNLSVYLPKRLKTMTGLYGITRSMLAPFETKQAKALTPALVIVHFNKEWTEYGGLLGLQDAELTSPFVFALSRDLPTDSLLARDYPNRHVLYYYSDQPNEFFDSPR
jgi:4-amino-4-deoxy-L-arabinose transferase-like glycosyltransferase